jgi:glutaredoxin 3
MRAKDLLKRKGIPFEEKLIGWDDAEAMQALQTRSGMRTMPQIFIGDACIGGFRELDALERSGELEKKLA